MIAYQLDKYGHFIGYVERQKDPLTGNWLLPGGSIEIPPPEIPENHLAKWDGVSWSIVEDKTKKKFYHKKTREEKTFDFEEEITEEYTELPPIEDEKFQIFDGEWKVDLENKISHLKKTKRSQRDNKIFSVAWMLDRHKQEELLGLETSLSNSKYTELLRYIQSLRDFTKQDEWWLKDIEEWNG